MHEGLLKLVPTLTIPRVLAAGLAIALGVNGAVQLGLQRDMKSKVEQLQQQVSTAKNLSGQMNGGLSNLSAIRSSTVNMDKTLGHLESVTATMDNGLQKLSATVSGIDSAVQHVSTTTGGAATSTQKIAGNLVPLLNLLTEMQDTNRSMESNLRTMQIDEQSINQDLAQMDHKTSALP